MKTLVKPLLLLIALALLSLLGWDGLGAQGGGSTTRVSLSSSGMQGDFASEQPSLSADGQLVAFASYASTLVSGDTNGEWDIFVRDRATGQTTRVSRSSGGEQGNGAARAPALSADGRWVAFESAASNLVSGDTNAQQDIFLHDRQTGQTTRVSVASDGSEANDYAYGAAISGDGRYISFSSSASNLVAGGSTVVEVYVHDRESGQTTLVSRSTGGAAGNENSTSSAISEDGRYVTFGSWANNLVSGDTNNWQDVFVHDRTTGQTTRISLAWDGAQSNRDSYAPDISADGRLVAFHSTATNLVPGDLNDRRDIFVHDRQTGLLSRVSVASDGMEANNHSWYPVLSGDGRWVAWESQASNLVSGDTNNTWDVYLYDRDTRQTTRVSVSSAGAEGNGQSTGAALGSSGSVVAWESWASNLVDVDINGTEDVFVRDLGGAPPPPPNPSVSPTATRVVTATPIPTYTVEQRVATPADDVEEVVGDGTIYLESSDLELVNDGGFAGQQLVGLRFPALLVPQGAIITRAYLEFSTDEPDSGSTTLTFYAQASDDAPAFTEADHNLSSRARSAAVVTWSGVAPWDGEHVEPPNPRPVAGRSGDRQSPRLEQRQGDGLHRGRLRRAHRRGV